VADGPAYALQVAVIARLRADTDLGAVVGPKIFDEPPPSQYADYPFVHLGRLDDEAVRIGCHTDDDILFTIECHTRPVAGRVEVLALAHAVRRALDDAPLTLSGHSLDWCDFLTQSVNQSRDGATWTAVLAFEASVAAAV